MPTDKKEEIIKLIGDLSVKKGNDICGFSTEFVKIIPHDIAPILTDIFNTSSEIGIFLDRMKIAMISPIYKGGLKLEISNYRPLSVLPILTKLLQRLLQNRLTKFLDENKKIYEHHFGFQKNKRTLAVLDFKSKTLKTLEKQEYTCSSFLDFEKTFDSVDHGILLKETVPLWF